MQTHAVEIGERDRLGRSRWRPADGFGTNGGTLGGVIQSLHEIFGQRPKTAGGTPALPNPTASFRFRPACLALAVFLLVHSAFAATFTALLDRDTTTVGEHVVLSLTFQDGAADAVPQVPSQPNLAITYLGPSSQYSFVNGKASSSVSHRYQIIASQAGNYTLPAITVIAGGKALQSQPLTLRVVKSALAAEESQLSKFAFLQILVPANEVYVGESFPVETRLHYLSAQELQMPQLTAEGFTLGKPAPPAQGRLQIGSTMYNVYVFKQTAVAAKAGNLTLGPATCDLVLRLPQAQRPRRDPNDFLDFFNLADPRVRLQRASLRSDPVPIKVLPLPRENVPPDFTGAIGEFSLSVSAGPTNVAVGDPITLTIKAAGRGAFDALAIPDAIQRWAMFKTYPATTKFEPSEPLGLEGVKTFEQVVVPESAQVKELPAFSFSFFDPKKKTYKTLKQPATPLTVRPSSQPTAQPTVIAATQIGQPSPETPARDIVHIKQRAGLLAYRPAALIERPWFLMIQAIPVLGWLSALVWRQRARMLATNPRLRRQRQVHQTVRAGLRELKRAAAEDRSEAFFATTFRLLQEVLGERLDLPASSITESVIDEHLRPGGVAESVLQPLQELFQTCNQARFAPSVAADDLARLLGSIESLLRQLSALPHRHEPNSSRK